MNRNIALMRASITVLAYLLHVLLPLMLTAIAVTEVHPVIIVPGLFWVICGARIAMYIDAAFNPDSPLYAKALAEKVMGIKE